MSKEAKPGAPFLKGCLVSVAVLAAIFIAAIAFLAILGSNLPDDEYVAQDMSDPPPQQAEASAEETLQAEEEEPDPTGGERRIGFSFTTATLKRVRMALDSSSDVTSLAEIPRDANEIYCLGDLAYAPSGTKVTAKWFFHGEAGDESQFVAEKTLHAEDSTSTVHFSLTRSETAFFSKGKYSVHLFINDKEDTSLDFTVRDPTMEELVEKASRGDIEAQFGIFAMYIQEKGGTLSAPEALQWLWKAAEAGHAIAQYNQALLYQQGHGVSKDLGKAVEWYRKSAEQGHPDSEFNLGICYRDGLGVDKSLTEAIVWTRKAADHGQVMAQYNLGVHYNTGLGLPENPAEAAKWFQKSGEQGYAPSLYVLGEFFEEGRGVEKNATRAVELYRAAAEQGHIPAQEALSRFEKLNP